MPDSISISNSVSNQTNSIISLNNSKAKEAARSLSEGIDHGQDAVIKFLGNTLADNKVVYDAMSKNTSYTLNMQKIAVEYLDTLSTSISQALKVVASAGPLSSDKLAVLQESIENQKLQIKLLVDTAFFDGKQLLGGDVKDIEVSAGLKADQNVKVSIQDFGRNRVLRLYVTNTLNDWVVTNAGAGNTYYANAAEITADDKNGLNLIGVSLANAGGTGTGGARMTDGELAAAIIAIRTAEAAAGSTKFVDKLNAIATASKVALNATNAGDTFANANLANMTTAIGVAGVLTELQGIFSDDTKIDNSANRAHSQHLFTESLENVRAEQARLANQIENVDEVGEALLNTANVTEDASNSFIKTNYVKLSQDYADLHRKVLAAIEAMNAANKLAQAALDAVRKAAQ